MKILKRILVVLAVLLLVAQFIRPARNAGDTSRDITAAMNVPEDVDIMLRTSCYDCHSNETRYPWYAELQPVGWWLNDHIQDAKRELNFSEFKSFRVRRQYVKLQESAEQLEKNLMPLPSYLFIHTDSRLSEQQKERLISWINASRDSMKKIYPPDSLERRR